MFRRAIGTVLCGLMVAAPAAALDVQIKQLHTPTNVVATVIELHEIVPERFKRIVDDGGPVHLRVQAELWEARPVWDRLVYPAIVRAFRLTRPTGSRDITVTDPAGTTSTYASVPNPFAVIVEMGKADRIDRAQHYYVRVVATVGTIAEREIDDVGDAVFGRPEESNTLGTLSRMIFRKALEIGDYLQSVTTEVKGRKTSGEEILKR